MYKIERLVVGAVVEAGETFRSTLLLAKRTARAHCNALSAKKGEHSIVRLLTYRDADWVPVAAYRQSSTGRPTSV